MKKFKKSSKILLSILVFFFIAILFVGFYITQNKHTTFKIYSKEEFVGKAEKIISTLKY